MARQRSRTPPQKQIHYHPAPYDAVARRSYTLRHSPKRVQRKGSVSSHGTHVADASVASRPVLVPLPFNLRSLPSRCQAMAPTRARDSASNASSDARIGSKRKRIGNANENGHIHTRSSRATGKFKRQRSLNDSSEEDVSSRHIMDVDDGDKNSQDWSSDLSDGEDGLLGDCELRVLVASPSRLT